MKKNEWVFVPASSSAPAANGTLGTYTKLVSPSPATQKKPDVAGSLEKKEERLKLQEKGKKYAPIDGFYRFKRCWKKVVWGKQVEVRKNTEGKARIRGIEQCGDVWACPVCAPKIQYQRGLEIKQAVDKAYKEGLKVYMLTLTHPHYKGQPLAGLIKMHNSARKKFWGGKFIMKWKQQMGFHGSISASEVMGGGANGWHWHTHVIVFTQREISLEDEYILKGRWANCLKRAGFNVNLADVMEHGLDLMRDCHASDYLTKLGYGSWGIEREVQGSSCKAGVDGSMTPFQLLEADKIGLWQEYLIATKGKKQLVWSRGLKKWAGLLDKQDDELLEEDELDEGELLAVIPTVVWYRICRNGQRVEVLRQAEAGTLRQWADKEKYIFYFPPPAKVAAG